MFPALPLTVMEEPGKLYWQKCFHMILPPGNFGKLCPRVICVNVSRDINLASLYNTQKKMKQIKYPSKMNEKNDVYSGERYQ